MHSKREKTRLLDRAHDFSLQDRAGELVLVPHSHNSTPRLSIFQGVRTPANGLPNALEIFLAFANLFPRRLPALHDLFPSLVRQRVQRGPVQAVVVFEFHVAAVNLHQLLRRYHLPHINVKFHLLSGQRVDERVYQLEEPPHEPGHVLDARVAESLWIMVLQYRKGLSALSHGRVLAFATLLEVDQDGQRFLTGRNQVDAALEHEDEMLHLLFPPLCILSVRIEVQAGSAFVVVAKDDLLARLVFFGYVVCCMAFDFEFAAPD